MLTAEQEQIATQLVNFYKRQGFTDSQAAGIVGNFVAESDLNPEAFNAEGGGQGALGLAQFRGVRQTNLREFAAEQNKSANDIMLQAAFSIEEMETYERATREALAKARSPEEAARVFEETYERSGGSGMARRRRAARHIYELTADRGDVPVGDRDEQVAAARAVGVEAPETPDDPEATVLDAAADVIDPVLDYFSNMFKEEEPLTEEEEREIKRNPEAELLLNLGVGLGQLAKGAPVDLTASIAAQDEYYLRQRQEQRLRIQQGIENRPAMAPDKKYAVALAAGVPKAVAMLVYDPSKDAQNTVNDAILNTMDLSKTGGLSSIEARNNIASALEAVGGVPKEVIEAAKLDPEMAEFARDQFLSRDYLANRSKEFTPEERLTTAERLLASDDPLDRAIGENIKNGFLTKEQYTELRTRDIRDQRQYMRDLDKMKAQGDVNVETARQQALDKQTAERREREERANALASSNPRLAELMQTMSPSEALDVYENERKEARISAEEEVNAAKALSDEIYFKEAADAYRAIYGDQEGANEVLDSVRDAESLSTALQVLESEFAPPSDARMAEYIEANPDKVTLITSLSATRAGKASPGEKAIVKRIERLMIETDTQIADASRLADQMGMLMELVRANPDLASGPIAANFLVPATTFLKEMGIDAGLLDDTDYTLLQLIDSTSSALFSYLRAPGSGAMSDFEADKFIRALPGMGDNPLKIMAVGQAIVKSAERRKLYAQYSNQYFADNIDDTKALNNDIKRDEFVNKMIREKHPETDTIFPIIDDEAGLKDLADRKVLNEGELFMLLDPASGEYKFKRWVN